MCTNNGNAVCVWARHRIQHKSDVERMKMKETKEKRERKKKQTTENKINKSMDGKTRAYFLCHEKMNKSCCRMTLGYNAALNKRTAEI